MPSRVKQSALRLRYRTAQFPRRFQPFSNHHLHIFLEIAGPLLRNHYQKGQLLGDRLCPVDTRIQSFLDDYLSGIEAARLPAHTFVLDRPHLARVLSLPPDVDHLVVALSAVVPRPAGNSAQSPQ